MITFDEIVKRLAEKEGIQKNIVIEEMMQAILAGFQNEDPAVQAQWKKLFPDGDCPTPEKFIETMAREVVKEEKIIKEDQLRQRG